MADDFNLTKELKAADELRGRRNKERIQKQKSPNLQQRGVASRSTSTDKVDGGYTNRQARASGKGRVLEEADKRGKLQRLELQAALAQKRRAERMKQEYLAKATAGELSDEDKDDKDKDYPNPIGIFGFLGFGVIASIQDGVPAVFDLTLGIGWIFGYILLPFTWFFYWYIIIRRAPKSLQRKFIMRTALVTAAGLIPYIGEILPEWIATAIGAYIYIKRYEAGGVGLEEVSTTTKKLAQGSSASK